MIPKQRPSHEERRARVSDDMITKGAARQRAPRAGSGSAEVAEFKMHWWLYAAGLVYGWFSLLEYLDAPVRAGLKSGMTPYSDAQWETPLVATVGYIIFIAVGNRVMRDRKPMQATGLMFGYNVFQTTVNLWNVSALVYEAYRMFPAPWGNPIDTRMPQGHRMAFLIWAHYCNKYSELMDTVFMVLRKKTTQISFLHVYHHTLLIWSWWYVMRMGAGGDAYFGSGCNSFIHVVMYGYYAMASLKIPCPWKKNITMMQMAQFAIVAMNSLYVLYKGTMHWTVPALQLFVMTNMLVLFGRFFRKAYAKDSKKKAA